MIRVFDDFSAAKHLWDTITGANRITIPFYLYEWHHVWWNTFQSNGIPFLVSPTDAVIAPFIRQGNSAVFSGGREIADYLDIIGPDAVKSGIWPMLLRYLKSRGILSLRLHNIPDSPTLSFFRHLSETTSGITLSREDTTPTIPLPQSRDAYLSLLDRRNRHELKRKLRRFEHETGNVLFIRSTSPSEDVHALLKLMELDEKKKTFLTPAMRKFFQRLPAAFPDQCSLFWLTMENEKIAGVMAFQSGTDFFTYNSGYDRERYSGAGYYLKARLISWAIEQHFLTFNFLQGNERYKYELGAKDAFVYSVSAELSRARI
ncbi:GNAT family N-acetyltransferase [Patescibacteria group bacterium]|nr:GNAT family N-acetyltransferase [Patescibacteria group bacterium]